MGNTGTQRTAKEASSPQDDFVYTQSSLLFEDMQSIRRQVARFLTEKSVPEHCIHNVTLAITEILSNLVKHPAEPLSQLVIRVQATQDRIDVDIADNCPSFTEFAATCRRARSPQHTLALEEESGYGLSLVMEVTSDLRYVDKHTSDDNLNHCLASYTVTTPVPAPRPAKTLFLIDDDPISLEIHKAMLEPAYRVLCFDKAAEALHAFLREQPDIIISDLMMPDMNGMELRRNLSALKGGDTTPFVFLSGNTKEQNNAYLSNLGIDDFLCKPITQDRLHTVLQRLLKRSHQIHRSVHEEFNDDISELLKPSVPSHFPNWSFHLMYETAEAGGGDFILHQETRNKNLALALADVMGHGRQAKFFAYMYAGYLRSIFRVKGDFKHPAEFLHFVSRAVGGDPLLESIIMTCQCFLIFPDGTVHIASAGHPPPVLIRKADQSIAPVAVAGPLLGLAGDNSYDLTTLHLASGDRLLLATDGFLDAFEVNNQSTPSLEEHIARNLSLDSDRLASALWNTFLAQRETNTLPKDDATTIIMEYGG